MLLATSPRLTLFALLAVPVVVGSIVVLGRRVRHQSRALQDRIADLGGAVKNLWGPSARCRRSGHEPHASRNFARVVGATFDAATRYARSRAGLNAFVILIVFGAIGLLLWRGGHDVVAGRISGGDLFAFIFYSGLVAGAVGALSEVATDLQRAAGATDRLFELLGTEPSIRAPASPRALPVPPVGTVAFEDVSFRYPSRPDLPAIAHLSFTVARGETVALVGPSGAGKSTVLQLLLRFTIRRKGRVLLDGVDVRDADPHELRSRLAIVPQDPVIFSTDAWTNIRYGRPDASDEAGDRSGARSPCRRFSARLAQRLRHVPRRARRAAIGRSEAANCDRARDPARPRGAAARRGHLGTRFRERTRRASGVGNADAWPHHLGHRAPAFDHSKAPTESSCSIAAVWLKSRSCRPRPHKRALQPAGLSAIRHGYGGGAVDSSAGWSTGLVESSAPLRQNRNARTAGRGDPRTNGKSRAEGGSGAGPLRPFQARDPRGRRQPAYAAPGARHGCTPLVWGRCTSRLRVARR